MLTDLDTLRLRFEDSERESEHGFNLHKYGIEYADEATQARWEAWVACRAAMLQGADGNSPVIPEWQAKAEKMAEIHGTSFVVFRNGESPQCAEPSKVIISFTDEGLGHGDTGNFREIVNSSTKDFRENAEASTKCWCRTCRPITLTDMRFVVCPECGNKRCPHANDHRNACTGSNEPGQEGSAYPAAPQQEVK